MEGKRTIGDVITDEFVEAMQDPVDQTGAMARIVAMECLPAGVNPDDPRVKEIIEGCKKHTGKIDE